MGFGKQDHQAKRSQWNKVQRHSNVTVRWSMWWLRSTATSCSRTMGRTGSTWAQPWYQLLGLHDSNYQYTDDINTITENTIEPLPCKGEKSGPEVHDVNWMRFCQCGTNLSWWIISSAVNQLNHLCNVRYNVACYLWCYHTASTIWEPCQSKCMQIGVPSITALFSSQCNYIQYVQ